MNPQDQIQNQAQFASMMLPSIDYGSLKLIAKSLVITILIAVLYYLLRGMTLTTILCMLIIVVVIMMIIQKPIAHITDDEFESDGEYVDSDSDADEGIDSDQSKSHDSDVNEDDHHDANN